jgi:hypothetical protein
MRSMTRPAAGAAASRRWEAEAPRLTGLRLVHQDQHEVALSLVGPSVGKTAAKDETCLVFE